MVSTGKKESSSHWAAKGLSSLSAKALAESRKASCCSVRSKFMLEIFFYKVSVGLNIQCLRRTEPAAQLTPPFVKGGRGGFHQALLWFDPSSRPREIPGLRPPPLRKGASGVPAALLHCVEQ